MRLKVRNMERENLRKDVQYDPTDVYNTEDAMQEWIECVDLDSPALDEGQPPEPAKFVCDEIGSPAVKEWRQEEGKRRKTETAPFSVGIATKTDVIGGSPKRKSSQKGKSKIDDQLIDSDDETEEEDPKAVGYKTHDDDDEDDGTSKSSSSSGFAGGLRAKMGSTFPDTEASPPRQEERGRQISDDREHGSQSERKTYHRKPKPGGSQAKGMGGPGGSQASGMGFATGIFDDLDPYYMDPQHQSYPYADPPNNTYANPPSYPYADPPSYTFADPKSYQVVDPPSYQYANPPSYPYANPPGSYDGVDSLSDSINRVQLGSSQTASERSDSTRGGQTQRDFMNLWNDVYCWNMSWDEFQQHIYAVHNVWVEFEPQQPARSSMWN